MTGEPFQFTSGPRDSRIVLVGEAWGEQESIARRPFVGSSGQELRRMLRQAGLDFTQCLATNVFQFRPEGNNIDLLCGKRSDVPANYEWPALSAGKYVRPEYLGETLRLQKEIISHPRNLVVCLGNTACWAVLGSPRIGSIRGTVSLARLVPGVKVLATYHPASVLRNWSQRPIVVADFMKAAREAQFPDIRRPRREVTIEPSLDDIHRWIQANRYPGPLSVDIETGHGLIKCIGFGSDWSRALVVPFVDRRKPDWSYWPDASSEREAWDLCQSLLSDSRSKVCQNGLYDMQYLLRAGFRLRGFGPDTMLQSHALYPELPKSLGFLGSIHTSEASWKLMRRQSEVNKRDE